MRDRLPVIALAVFLALTVSRVAAAEIIDCGAGDTQCLIAAINVANADPHRTTIRLAGSTYTFTNIDNDTNGTNALPSITSTVTIDGGIDGATLARAIGAPVSRILHVGASGRLTLQGVTIAHAVNLSVSLGALYNNQGVVNIIDSTFRNNELALYNNHGVVKIIGSSFRNNDGTVPGVTSVGGVVDITRTIFENNDGDAAGGLLSMGADVRITQSRFRGGHGHLGVGGIFLSGGTASIVQTTFERNLGDGVGGIFVQNQGTLIVQDSAFVENLATSSAGIMNLSGTVNVINTTFARNAAVPIFGGGIAVLNFGTMTLRNSTFAENTTLGGGISLSVIKNESGATALLENSIVVHNSEDTDVQDCAGTVTSLGNNLIGDPFACGMVIQLTDRIGDAGLGGLVDDGTPGNAHYPLLPESEAIDGANRRVCPVRDQIGQLRRPRCDIGAVEFDDRALGRNATK